MNPRLLLAGAVALLALTAAARERPEVKPAARATGEPQSCLRLTQFGETRIRDDWTIDFISGAGRKVWRNALPRRCPGLRSDDAFTYQTSLSELCSTDIIHSLQRWGGSLHRGAGCGLGKFVPVELEKKPR
jgi:hypothetical protein